MSKRNKLPLVLGGFAACLIIAGVSYRIVTREPGSDADRALVMSAKKEDLAGVKKALDAGADVNAKLGQSKWQEWNDPPEPNLGYTALHYAAEWIDVPIEKVLLEHKADPDALSLDGRTPIMIATSHLGVEFIKILLAAGADPARKDHYNHNAMDHLPRMGTAASKAPVIEILGGRPPRQRRQRSTSNASTNGKSKSP